MTKRSKKNDAASMLELWRAPSGAGEAIGCIASTYTFHPDLFDEHCLARFLEIESDPDREDLAFLLEREMRLGPAYAGVLVDHTQAGVEHSLRWDVLPVRIPNGKQHAKLSLLAWTNHVRLIVASANLTTQGYRLNHEICQAFDSDSGGAHANLVGDAIDFLRRLLAFVPGATPEVPEVNRATEFLEQVEKHVSQWSPVKLARGQHQHLVFTLPGGSENPATGKPGFESASSLDEAIKHCSRRGGAPERVRVASPFFDADPKEDQTTKSLCKSMARGGVRWLRFCVPAVGTFEQAAPRLAAPKSLTLTANNYVGQVTVAALPQQDAEGNERIWHAKMLSMVRRQGDGYSGLLIGSSNFTGAGMGVGAIRNAEANVLTIADHLPKSRLPKQVRGVWPEVDQIEDMTNVEWLGRVPDEEENAARCPLPAGFLPASFWAGDQRRLSLRFAPDSLPTQWTIFADGRKRLTLLSEENWMNLGGPQLVDLPWQDPTPPESLLVEWTGGDGQTGDAILPLNVANAAELPPLVDLAEMSADEMLMILASSDPSAAVRAWAKKQGGDGSFDGVLDSASPVDLDPLRRYDLQGTFLRRVRNRARVLAQLRANLQRPAFDRQRLLWRLDGFVGVRPLAQRLLRELSSQAAGSTGSIDEAVLAIVDYVILLSEVEYQSDDGAMSEEEFAEVYWPFLNHLLDEIGEGVHAHRSHISGDIIEFWNRVVKQCRSRAFTTCLPS